MKKNHNEHSVQIYDTIAEAYQAKFMDMDIYDSSYACFCAALQVENPRVLELACGPGNISRYLLNQRPDIRLLATDLAPNMLRLTKQNVPKAEVQLLDCREIKTLQRTFNGIICGFALPYLSAAEVEQLLKDSHTVLEEQGVLYLSCIEGEYEKSGPQSSSDGKTSMFIYYYPADFLINCLSDSGFEAQAVLRVPYPPNDTHLIVIARKKIIAT